MGSFININKIFRFAEEFENSCMLKTAFIKKLPNGEWTILSLKGKQLGKYKTKQEAVKQLKRIEWFKNHKKASKEDTYSSVMRELRKSQDDETVNKFQKEFKKLFDNMLLNQEEIDPENLVNKALECISNEDYKRSFEKKASAVELGDPNFAGKYLADLLKFLLRRIKPENRQKAIDSLRNKVYFLNEYQISGKKTPPSASMGQGITLLKTILLEHSPEYIRAVLNSIARNL